MNVPGLSTLPATALMIFEDDRPDAKKSSFVVGFAKNTTWV